MHAEISSRLTELQALCRRYGVARLEVFGSAARGADFDLASSDADFLVEFEPAVRMSPLGQFFGLADDLQQLLGRPVDLVETNAIRNPYVIANVNAAREIVYAA